MCGHCPSLGPSDTGCGLGLAPRSPVRLCGWRDQSPGWWALRLLESGVYAVLSGCAAGQLLAHTFMANSCGDDMTKPNFLRGSSSDSCFLRTRQTPLITCLSGQRGCGQCPHLVHNRLLDPHFDPFLMVSAETLHAGLCCRRHDFAARIVGFVGRSGFSGNVSGGVCGWRSGPSTERRCVGSGLFFRGGQRTVWCHRRVSRDRLGRILREETDLPYERRQTRGMSR
jgi:hypothetical protein